jgi:amphi-Trp domain-containing protein
MKNEISFKKTANVHEAAKILEDLARTVKEGKVCIETGKKFITLTPMGDISVEIEAEVKKDKEKMVIEMAWRRSDPVKEQSAGLKISSIEPAVDSSDEDDDEKDKDKNDPSYD